MNDPTVTLAIPILGIFLAAALGYASGRLLEGRKQLILQKGLAYADYLKALSISATDSRSTVASGLAADAKTRMCIYGSPRVIERLSAFERGGAKIIRDENKGIIAELILAMRRDVGLHGRPPKEAHVQQVLFGPTKIAP